MKLTKKSTKKEVETTETVCEITQDEFEQLCAKTAAHTVVNMLGNNPDLDDFVASVVMTRVFADFTAHLVGELFDNNENTENPDKKEEK